MLKKRCKVGHYNPKVIHIYNMVIINGYNIKRFHNRITNRFIFFAKVKKISDDIEIYLDNNITTMLQ